MVGTMTRYKVNLMHSGTNLIGIRFKPAGFSAFYDHSSLYKLTDETVEFDPKIAPDLDSTVKTHFTAYLDHFFLKILSKLKRSLAPTGCRYTKPAGSGISVNTLADNMLHHGKA